MSQTKVQLIDLGSAIASSTPTNGLFVTAANTVAISTNSVERLKISTSEVVFNDAGNDIDFRVEGDTNANLLFVDASTDRVGIGDSAPDARLTVKSSGASTTPLNVKNSGATEIFRILQTAGGSGRLIVSDSTGTDFFNVQADQGRVGIGTTSPAASLDVNGSAHLANSSYLGFGNADALIQGSSASGANFLMFRTSLAERARIDHAGRLLVGTSSILGGSGAILQAKSSTNAALFVGDTNTEDIIAAWNTATSGNNLFMKFGTETSFTIRGSIDYNRAAGQVRYNVTSDRRLKSEIQPAHTALNALSAIQVRSYKWSETGYQVDHGFIAQELNEVAPDAVKVGDDGEEVTDAWAVDNGKLVPLLTKALQEAIGRIETLEVEVAALKAQ